MGLSVWIVVSAGSVLASDPAAEGAGGISEASGTGPVTGRPLPRFVSLRDDKANVRRGPGTDHRIDWVLVRKSLPLEVIAEYGNWRQIRDYEGATGWLHSPLLRGMRTGQITENRARMYATSETRGRPVALLEAGVTGRLLQCQRLVCRLETSGISGWIFKTDFFGAFADEVFE